MVTILILHPTSVIRITWAITTLSLQSFATSLTTIIALSRLSADTVSPIRKMSPSEIGTYVVL